MTERPWFRWSLAVVFLLVMFLGTWLAGPPSYQTDYETEYSAQRVEAPISADERLADYTEALAVFTCGLLVIGGLQIWLLFRTDKTAKANSEIASRQAEATEKQTALIGLQADMITRQKDIQRLQFMAQFGPKLRIRNVVVYKPTKDGLMFQGRDISGRLYVENVGKMTCTILDSHLMFFAHQMGLPMGSPYEGVAANNKIQGKFNIGESIAVDFSQTTVFTTPQEAERAFAGNHPVYLLGWIDYRDDSEQGIIHEVVHRLGFCRRWDTSKRRWVPVEDQDYEYET